MLKILKKIQNYYVYDSIVLETSSGTVYLGINDISKEKVLIQVVSKQRFSNKSSDSLANFVMQLNFLKETFCKNWLSFVDFIETSHSFYVITESPGDKESSLKEIIGKTGPLIKNEKSFFILFIQLLKAYIPFCCRNQPHLNLKTKNIYQCIDEKTQKLYYKISPFFHYNHLETIQDEMIDYSHLPPEIIDKLSFSSKSDMWSIGLVLYETIMGTNPFESNEREIVLKKINYLCKDKTSLFPSNIKFSEECTSFILNLIEPNGEKRMNWKDLFKHKFIQNQGSSLKYSLINQIKNINEVYSTNLNIPPDLMDAIKACKEDFYSASRQINIFKKIELSGEFELIENLKEYRILEECKEFYAMKIFDDEIKFQNIPNILNKTIKNLSPHKRKSLFINLDNKVLKEKTAETCLLPKKLGSDFSKKDIIPSTAIKTFGQAKKTMTAKYLYQREIVKQFRMYLDFTRSFSREMQTLLMEYTISKFVYFRFQYFKDRLLKEYNIFDLPFWQELKTTNDYLNMVQNCPDLFSKDHSETYYAFQTFRENTKGFLSLNHSETFFIQLSFSLNQQVFMETDFVSGFKSFAILFLEKLVNNANNEFAKNRKNSRKYYEMSLRTIEFINFAQEYGITKFEKNAKWDLEEIGERIDQMDIEILNEQTNLKFTNLLK